MSFDKTKCKHFFDESIGKFHFYDHLFCIPNYLDGVKISFIDSKASEFLEFTQHHLDFINDIEPSFKDETIN